jgi:hypothetical protein
MVNEIARFGASSGLLGMRDKLFSGSLTDGAWAQESSRNSGSEKKNPGETLHGASQEVSGLIPRKCVPPGCLPCPGWTVLPEPGL